jgi:acyl-homoserine lactone acylase PvdQ
MMVVLFIFPNFKNSSKDHFMKHLRYSIYLLLCLLIAYTAIAQKANSSNVQNSNSAEKARWEKHVAQTTIIRDEWGVPHIYGKTDADAVFGLMYAQCEENFPQIEKNYLEMLGRLQELKENDISVTHHEEKIYADLMMKLIQDSTDAIKDYNKSPVWFQKLLQAHADGINYYLAKHPNVRPQVITKFKPWYHLMWTDGSVSPTRSGGIKEIDVAKFYGQVKDGDVYNKASSQNLFDMEDKTLKGSNGFAIAPMHSKSGNAMLYINPHVPFYFRSEMHMVSEEGLNVYGAVTWGQLFIYQGFNEHAGWMHTSSYADVADVYLEKVVKNASAFTYEYENKQLPIITRVIDVKYYDNGVLKTKLINTYKTHHGPVMGSKDGKWLSLHENNRSLNALIECWTRTKSKNLKDYTTALNLLANNSNNTVYADADGNIAYWHGNFMPKRNDPSFDYTRPVDGTLKATDWNGVHPLNEIVQSINPVNGWLQNCNATPFTVAGDYSPKATNYPSYMAPDGENPRGLNAVRLLGTIDKINLDELIKLGYNKHLTAFDILLPSMISESRKIQTDTNVERARKNLMTPELEKALDYLEKWNHDANTNSIAQSIAIMWMSEMNNPNNHFQFSFVPSTEEEGTMMIKRFESINEKEINLKLFCLKNALNNLKATYGSWEIPWGQINRYQRVNPGTNFNDSEASIAVAQTSSKYGQLPAFESKIMFSENNSRTTKRYGYSGNSFVAAVSFGKKLEAKTIITGGQSRWANDKHFTDQAQDYIDGNFKTIHFYKEDVLAHKVTSYKPGLER